VGWAEKPGGGGERGGAAAKQLLPRRKTCDHSVSNCESKRAPSRCLRKWGEPSLKLRLKKLSANQESTQESTDCDPKTRAEHEEPTHNKVQTRVLDVQNSQNMAKHVAIPKMGPSDAQTHVLNHAVMSTNAKLRRNCARKVRSCEEQDSQ